MSTAAALNLCPPQWGLISAKTPKASTLGTPDCCRSGHMTVYSLSSNSVSVIAFLYLHSENSMTSSVCDDRQWHCRSSAGAGPPPRGTCASSSIARLSTATAASTCASAPHCFNPNPNPYLNPKINPNPHCVLCGACMLFGASHTVAIRLCHGPGQVLRHAGNVFSQILQCCFPFSSLPRAILQLIRLPAPE